jgi:hypothetical protein
MTEMEWIACTDPDVMLEFLKGKISDRKLRLFACACCRRIEHLLRDDHSRKVIDAAEQFADGEIDFDSLQVSLAGPNQPKKVLTSLCEREAWWAANFVTWEAAAQMSEGSWDPTGRLYLAESAIQCHLLRDIVGEPLRPIFIHRKRLETRKGHALSLARTIYENRSFDRLPQLAETLAQAGYTDEVILSHCRGPGPHVPGCFVLDVILGKS